MVNIGNPQPCLRVAGVFWFSICLFEKRRLYFLTILSTCCVPNWHPAVFLSISQRFCVSYWSPAVFFTICQLFEIKTLHYAQIWWHCNKHTHYAPENTSKHCEITTNQYHENTYTQLHAITRNYTPITRKLHAPVLGSLLLWNCSENAFSHFWHNFYTQITR